MGSEEDTEQALSHALLDFSNIGRTVDGTGFAYRTVSCINKKISQIKIIAEFTHLNHVDLSCNFIKDVAPLKGLKYLLRLNLSQNRVVSIKSWDSGEEEEFFPHLMHLNLSNNALPDLKPVPLRALKTASFAKNEISACQDFGGYAMLETLDLAENHITSLAGVSSNPALKKLNIASNELDKLEGFTEVPKLEDLNLSGNKFETLEGPWQEFAELQILNVSNCQLQVVKSLEVLRHLPKLSNLGVAGNPFIETVDGNPRVEVLVCHWRLKIIDGEEVTEEELEEAKELNVKRQEEEAEREAERKAAEEAAAADT